MLCPWEFQDPKIEVLKHTRPYIIYIGILNGTSSMLTWLSNMLKWFI